MREERYSAAGAHAAAALPTPVHHLSMIARGTARTMALQASATPAPRRWAARGPRCLWQTLTPRRWRPQRRRCRRRASRSRRLCAMLGTRSRWVLHRGVEQRVPLFWHSVVSAPLPPELLKLGPAPASASIDRLSPAARRWRRRCRRRWPASAAWTLPLPSERRLPGLPGRHLSSMAAVQHSQQCAGLQTSVLPCAPAAPASSGRPTSWR